MTTHAKHRSYQAGAIAISTAILLIYTLLSVYKPFGGVLNTLSMGLLTALCALLTALSSTLVFRSYDPNDLPRAVWANFSIGFWLWVLAEISFALSSLELPSLLFARLLWLGAFGFFSYALYLQYKIIAGASAKSALIIIYYWMAVLTLAVLIVFLMGMSINFANVAEYFGALSNLVVGSIAIKLALTFRGGALARPWWGFVGLAISDIIYGLSTFLGSEHYNSLLLATELVYIAAYLSMAFGFYGQYLLLRFGVSFSNESES